MKPENSVCINDVTSGKEQCTVILLLMGWALGLLPDNSIIVLHNTIILTHLIGLLQ